MINKIVFVCVCVCVGNEAMRIGEDLDGVGEGEGDDIAGFDAGGEEARGGEFDEVVETGVREVELAGDGDGAAGGEYSGDAMEQSGECGWSLLHCDLL